MQSRRKANVTVNSQILVNLNFICSKLLFEPINYRLLLSNNQSSHNSILLAQDYMKSKFPKKVMR